MLWWRLLALPCHWPLRHTAAAAATNQAVTGVVTYIEVAVVAMVAATHQYCHCASCYYRFGGGGSGVGDCGSSDDGCGDEGFGSGDGSDDNGNNSVDGRNKDGGNGGNGSCSDSGSGYSVDVGSGDSGYGGNKNNSNGRQIQQSTTSGSGRIAAAMTAALVTAMATTTATTIN